ncbi:beta-propeller domain-containing protein [Brevundimonas sp.]|uniref:beta-propeller domain-containing protein n=1 Tax=Brevundimonas sp. TaxID=1871086 RepID=UPI002D39D848|nr:beta-propeller domain-containing protein [Brevundimonas sp.]HYC67673.1 beta-propeller domain-containing protein [Brevundimonas sp.]
MCGWRLGRTALVALVMVCGAGGAPALAQTADGLDPFRTEAELRRFLQERAGGAPVYLAPPVAVPVTAPPPMIIATPDASPATEAAAADYDADVQEIVLTASRAADPSITNTQVAGVDEGGIVKVRGDHLVILRRGRLFTVSTADGGLRPVDAINAYPPGVDAGGDWYDEMLVSGDQVVVIGYSYSRGGTEVSRFRLSPDGRLSFRDAYHMRSNDYYSSRNYASRLIGDELILYSPLDIGWHEDPLDMLPGVRRWTGDPDAPFQRIAGPRQVFIAPQMRRSEDGEIDALHTVSRCDLTAPELTCEATVVLGPEGRTFYVSSQAVYLWTSDTWRSWRRTERGDAPESSLYRIPLDGSRPQAVLTRGAPMDQFSFREDAGHDLIEVVVWSEGGGDEMWRPEFTEGAPALLRLPFSRFGDGSREAAARDYRFLADLPGDDEGHNRFVGRHLLLSRNGWNPKDDTTTGAVMVVPVGGGRIETFAFAEPVTRLEAIGRDALVVSGDDEVAFTTVDLSGRPRLADRYVAQAAGESESRSHGFFYSPDPGSRDGASGLLGLPVNRTIEGRHDYLFSSAADMLFLRRADRRLSELGRLASRADGAIDDACVASCADWYGNARPIFLRGRVFALLGYELVEGRVEGGGVREIGRLNFAPAARAED